jgi:hypothetical protein
VTEGIRSTDGIFKSNGFKSNGFKSNGFRHHFQGFSQRDGLGLMPRRKLSLENKPHQTNHIKQTTSNKPHQTNHIKQTTSNKPHQNT